MHRSRPNRANKWHELLKEGLMPPSRWVPISMGFRLWSVAKRTSEWKPKGRIYSQVHLPRAQPFQEGLAFHTYHLANTLSQYDDQVACNDAKWANLLQVQMRTQIFDPHEPIPLISFLPPLNLACVTNGIDGDTSIKLLHFFLEKQSAAWLNSRIAPSSNLSHKSQ